MKKLLLIPFMLVFALTFTGCDNTPDEPPTPPPAQNQETPPSGDASAFADFPTGPITIYNSSTAGSPADVMARELARSIEDIYNVPVTVNNAPGGGGGVLFGSVARSAADGYTWGSFTAAQIASLQAGLSNDFPIDTFQFVANIQTDVHAIAVQADAPWETLEDLIEDIQSRGSALQMGGQGTGSGMHLNALQFVQDADLDFVWIPFDGGAVTVTNLLGGHIEAGLTTPTTVREYVEAGMIRMLAVTGDSRLSTAPDVPTFEELGFPNVALTQYRGVYVDSRVDMDLVARISEIIREATLSDTFMAYMDLVGMDDTFMPYYEFHPYVLADLDRVGVMAEGLLD